MVDFVGVCLEDGVLFESNRVQVVQENALFEAEVDYLGSLEELSILEGCTIGIGLDIKVLLGLFQSTLNELMPLKCTFLKKGRFCGFKAGKTFEAKSLTDITDSFSQKTNAICSVLVEPTHNYFMTSVEKYQFIPFSPKINSKIQDLPLFSYDCKISIVGSLTPQNVLQAIHFIGKCNNSLRHYATPSKYEKLLKEYKCQLNQLSEITLSDCPEISQISRDNQELEALYYQVSSTLEQDLCKLNGTP